ncbi:hypothetical protein GCM10027053_09590 [Intrasporangium mesophilum]
MSAANETHVDQTEHTTDPEMADIVQWDTASPADRTTPGGRRDRSVGLAVAGITLAALLVGGLVAFVISLSG